jgi:tetratricopeptide (TPR) repeat protein
MTQKILIATVIALIGITFGYSTQVYSIYDVVKFLLLLLASSGLLLLFCMNKEKIPTTHLQKYILLFLLWLLMETFFSASINVSILGIHGRYQGLLFFFASLFFYFIGRHMKDNYRKIAIGFSIAAILLSILAIGEFWFKGGFRVSSTIGNPLFLANLLVLLLPFFLALIIEERRLVVRITALGGLFCVILADVFTFSRAGWWGAGLSLLLFMVLYGWRATLAKKWRFALMVTVVAVAVTAGTVMIKSQPGQVVIKNPHRLLKTVTEVVDNLRVMEAQVALKIFLEHPVFGCGISMFSFEATKYLPIEHIGDRPDIFLDMAHNDFLHTLATQGIAGGLFYFALLFLLWRKWNSWRKDLEARNGWTAALWTSIAIHLLLIQYSFPWVGYTYIFWLFIGVIDTPEKISVVKTNERPHLLPIKLRIILAGILLAITICFVYVSYQSEIYFAKGFLGSDRKGDPQVTANFDRAIHWAPWQYHFRYAKARYLVDSITSLPPAQRADALQEAAAETRTLLMDNPHDYRLHLLTGDLFRALRMPRKASEYYLAVLKLYPNYYPAFLRLGDLALREHDIIKAKQYYEKAISLYPQYKPALERIQWIEKKGQ